MTCDYAFYARDTKQGISRKSIETGDFFSSLDGLGYELGRMMEDVTTGWFLLEGYPSFSKKGTMWNRGRESSITVQGFFGLLASVQSVRGVRLLWSPGIEYTARLIESFRRYCMKEAHVSLLRRAPIEKGWWTPTASEQELYILQGYPGIGPKTAQAILDHCGRLPLRWDIAPKEMMAIRGIGKKTTERLFSITPGRQGGRQGELTPPSEDNPLAEWIQEEKA